MSLALKSTRITGTAAKRAEERARRSRTTRAHTFQWLRPGLLVVSGMSLCLLARLKLSSAETAFIDALQGTGLAPLAAGAFMLWLLGCRAQTLWMPPLAAGLAALLLGLGNQLLLDLASMPIAALWLSGVLTGLAALLISDWAYRQLLPLASWGEWLFSALVGTWFLSIVALMYRLETPPANWDLLQTSLVAAATGFMLLRMVFVLRGFVRSRRR